VPFCVNWIEPGSAHGCVMPASGTVPLLVVLELLLVVLELLLVVLVLELLLVVLVLELLPVVLAPLLVVVVEPELVVVDEPPPVPPVPPAPPVPLLEHAVWSRRPAAERATRASVKARRTLRW
jgi:hypothetical protein